MGYFILENCPVEGMTEFFADKLSESVDDYPEGIVIPLDKPLRWTSADLVRKVKFQLQRQFHSRKLKVGHAGTLDPMATGLLIICVGKATKIAEQLQAHEKEYIAGIEFGATTASFDLEQPVEATFPFSHIDRAAVEAALKGFIGEQEQVPPAFSAKVVGGLRAYEYARCGESVELRKSLVTINSIELLEFTPAGGSGQAVSEEEAPLPSPEENSRIKHVHNYHTAQASIGGSRPRALIRVRCSKGTYIRSLARDLGLALDSGAYLISLRRTASGPFTAARISSRRD